MLTIMSRPDQPLSEYRELSRQKSKQVIQDVNQCFVKTTENRNSTGHVIFTPVNTDVSDSQTSALPNFKK
jgi:hypothetical protein